MRRGGGIGGGRTEAVDSPVAACGRTDGRTESLPLCLPPLWRGSAALRRAATRRFPLSPASPSAFSPAAHHSRAAASSSSSPTAPPPQTLLPLSLSPPLTNAERHCAVPGGARRRRCRISRFFLIRRPRRHNLLCSPGWLRFAPGDGGDNGGGGGGQKDGSFSVGRPPEEHQLHDKLNAMATESRGSLCRPPGGPYSQLPLSHTHTRTRRQHVRDTLDARARGCSRCARVDVTRGASYCCQGGIFPLSKRRTSWNCSNGEESFQVCSKRFIQDWGKKEFPPLIKKAWGLWAFLRVAHQDPGQK